MDPQSPIVRIREDGMVEPLTRRSEMMLERRTGLLMLVEASPEVFVLRRLAAKDDPGRAVLLAGELGKRGALGQVLETIVRGSLTGELVVTDGQATRTLFVRESTIVGAVSSAADERIGAVMARMGLLDDAQRALVCKRLGAGKRFGELAVEEGFLSRSKLFEVVRQQVEDIVTAALSIERGAFAFLEGIDDAKPFARRHLEARTVLAAARARLAPASARAPEVDDPIAWFNAALSAIEVVAEQLGKLEALRAGLAAYTADSAIDRQVFACLTDDGTLDAARAAEVFERLGVLDPRHRLHEYVVYALFLACADAPSEVERALLAAVERPLAALGPRPMARHSGPPPLPSSRRGGARLSIAHAAVGGRAVGAAEESPPTLRTRKLDPRRLGTAAGLVLAAAVAAVVVSSVLQLPVGRRWMARMARWSPPPASSLLGQPPVVVPAPQASIVFAPSAEPSAPPPPVPSEAPAASAAKPASTLGTLHAQSAGSRRVWIDGKLVGETPRSFELGCGHHVVRVGSTGQPQMVDVPCGGEVTVGPK